MGLLDKFKSLIVKNDNADTDNTDLIDLNNITKSGLSIHPDLIDLIWIGDGKYRNYSDQPKSTMTYPYEGFTIKVSMFGPNEPSLLYLKYPLEYVQPSEYVERPPYYPFYSELTPKQKYLYWKFLSDPYNPNNDIGYVFIFYYGLERHLLYGNFEKAFDIILKLRDIYDNRSFQHYSASALILSTLIHKRAEYTQRFIDSLDKDHEFQMPGELYFLCKLSLGIPITPLDIMKFHKFFGFSNNRYIKNNTALFLKNLSNNIRYQNAGSELIDSKPYFVKANFSRLPSISLPIFANISIRDKEVVIPDISHADYFIGNILALLESAHQDTKRELASIRKQQKQESNLGETIELNPTYTKSHSYNNELIKIQSAYYDNLQKIEKQWSVLYNLKAYEGPGADKYIELCRLNIQQFLDMNERGKNFEDYETPISVPAYKRLSMIYEKQENFEDAFNVCIEAIKAGIEYDGTKSGFKGRAARMIKKSNIRPDEETISLLMS